MSNARSPREVCSTTMGTRGLIGSRFVSCASGDSSRWEGATESSQVASRPMEANRELDIVVFGATGFVGKLTAEYLAKHAPEGVKIGLAGRSEEKLARVKSELGTDWPTIVADSSDSAQLKALAERSSVVATTVGPYRKYGMPLVEACAAAGTDYIDLTGEPLFIRESIDRCHSQAEETGARIVHCVGFDSIPSDLGVWLLHQEAGELADTTLVVRGVRGGASGGTVDSMTTM